MRRIQLRKKTKQKKNKEETVAPHWRIRIKTYKEEKKKQEKKPSHSSFIVSDTWKEEQRIGKERPMKVFLRIKSENGGIKTTFPTRGSMEGT